MYSYITSELMQLLRESVPQLNVEKAAIMGHSMGGHGALTIGLKNPNTFTSISAFSPICNPSRCPWGVKGMSR
jgi:S-formylglutathione hydrolase